MTPELAQLQQMDTVMIPHRGPGIRRVVTPGRQKETNVVEIGMGYDVLKGLLTSFPFSVGLYKVLESRLHKHDSQS